MRWWWLLLAIGVDEAGAGELWDKVKEKASGVAEASAEAKEKVEDTLSSDESRQARKSKDFAVNASLSPFNMPFPMAWGLNGYYIASGDWLVGLDYLNSSKSIKFFSFDVGGISENNITLQAKRFVGNSFNLKFGIGMRQTEARFAKDLFDLATTSYSETAAEFEARYLRFGIGNQWQFKEKYSFTVDWFTVDIPFAGKVVTSASRYADTEEDRKDIRDAEDILKYYPGGALIKLEVGMLF